MADIVIHYTDVHNITTLTDVHIDPGGKIGTLLDMLICIMVVTLLYMIAAAYENCRNACSTQASKEEVVTAPLMANDQEVSSH